MHPSVKAKLARHFAPHNARLYALLGRDFGWERAGASAYMSPLPTLPPLTLEELVAGSRDLGAKAAADKAGAKERATGKQHRTRASTGLSQELSIAAHVTPPLADVV